MPVEVTQQIRAQLFVVTPLENGKINFITQRVEQELASDLAKYNVKFRGTTDSNFIGTLLSWVVPMLVFFAVWAFFFRNFAQKQGSAA